MQLSSLKTAYESKVRSLELKVAAFDEKAAEHDKELKQKLARTLDAAEKTALEMKKLKSQRESALRVIAEKDDQIAKFRHEIDGYMERHKVHSEQLREASAAAREAAKDEITACKAAEEKAKSELATTILSVKSVSDELTAVKNTLAETSNSLESANLDLQTARHGHSNAIRLNENLSIQLSTAQKALGEKGEIVKDVQASLERANRDVVKLKQELSELKLSTAKESKLWLNEKVYFEPRRERRGFVATYAKRNGFAEGSS